MCRHRVMKNSRSGQHVVQCTATTQLTKYEAIPTPTVTNWVRVAKIDTCFTLGMRALC